MNWLREEFARARARISACPPTYRPVETTGCDCSVHDITVPAAAHAVDCPMFE